MDVEGSRFIVVSFWVDDGMFGVLYCVIRVVFLCWRGLVSIIVFEIVDIFCFNIWCVDKYVLKCYLGWVGGEFRSFFEGICIVFGNGWLFG